MPMNPEVKASWLAALRGGEYEQGRQGLRGTQDVLGRPYEGGTERLCCLGVLCELAVKAGVTESAPDGPDGYTWYGHGLENLTVEDDNQDDDHSFTLLPSSVKEWAGLESSNPAVYIEDHKSTLAWFNDNGSTFSQIADLIEAQL